MAEYRGVIPAGEYGTIVIDPPWTLNSKGVRRSLHYDRMTTEEICRMRDVIQSHLHPDGHVWLWTTNPHMPEAVDVIRYWGLTYKTKVTWVKNRMGTGWWVRSKTEDVLLAVRSDRLRRNPGNVTSDYHAPYCGPHRKPDGIYRDRFERLSPGPYLELFARAGREGWTTVLSDTPTDVKD